MLSLEEWGAGVGEERGEKGRQTRATALAWLHSRDNRKSQQWRLEVLKN